MQIDCKYIYNVYKFDLTSKKVHVDEYIFYVYSIFFVKNFYELEIGHTKSVYFCLII